MLAALRKAGFPEWPGGFEADKLERVNGPAIGKLLFERVWIGKNQEELDTFVQRTTERGEVEYRVFRQFWHGTVSVKSDSVCYDIPALPLSREFCGRVYRNPKGTPDERNEYVLLDVFDVHHFSLKQ